MGILVYCFLLPVILDKLSRMKAIVCFLLMGIVAMISATPFYYPYHFGYVYYNGCHRDGYFYYTDMSFVQCSNGVGYVHHCAPGTKNREFSYFRYDNDYHYTEFCGIHVDAAAPAAEEEAAE